MILKFVFTYILLCVNIYALDYEQFLQQQNKEYNAYKLSFEQEFEAYKKAYTQGLKEYENEILNIWPKSEITTAHKWVQYDKNYTTKKSIDFKKQTIKLEVIAKNEKEARKKLLDTFDDLLKDDVKRAYKNDQLENKIVKKLNIQPVKIKSNEKIISDVIPEVEKNKLSKQIKTIPLIKVTHKNRIIYKANLKFPPKSLLRKAKLYRQDVNNQSNTINMDRELIYAIMHSESSFNPMARSHVPAYGLMQIVPKSAGVDTYRFLYGKKRLLNSTYLYNTKNNIKIGSTYLHILYFKYLRHIKDPQSRFYCTIAAYNTGAGNVAKTFVGSYNIKKASNIINAMTPEEVYKKLMRKLPYLETRKYLKKVNDRTFVYAKLLQEKQL
jgi:membrane-bound lytic murein transglycosylase C